MTEQTVCVCVCEQKWIIRHGQEPVTYDRPFLRICNDRNTDTTVSVCPVSGNMGIL